MSIIGSSPGIRLGPTVEIAPVLPAGSSDRNASSQSPAPTSAPSLPAAAVATSSAIEPGAVPIDQARIASIKKAIQTNSYPLLPAKIGDAMIAAGMLLRMSK